MPKLPDAPREECRRCGGAIALPHRNETECRTALSSEVDALLTRARKLSTSMWKLARIDRRHVHRLAHTPVTPVGEKKKRNGYVHR
jgi:hypothetical protein